MRRVTLIVLGLLTCSVSHAQTMYYCTKDGKKIVTDTPCVDIGATQTKQVDVQDMPPMNTSRGLTASEKRQGQQIDRRLAQQQRVHEQQVAAERTRYAQEQANNKIICKDLARQKQQIIAAQRARNSDWLNARHREVNDEIYKRRCETL